MSALGQMQTCATQKPSPLRANSGPRRHLEALTRNGSNLRYRSGRGWLAADQRPLWVKSGRVRRN